MEKETVMMLGKGSHHRPCFPPGTLIPGLHCLVTQRFEVKGKYGDVIKAMRDHMPANASVVVFGSVSPWYVAALIASWRHGLQ